MHFTYYIIFKIFKKIVVLLYYFKYNVISGGICLRIQFKGEINMKKKVLALLGASLVLSLTLGLGTTNTPKTKNISTLETHSIPVSNLSKEESALKMKELYEYQKQVQRYGARSSTINVNVDVAADQYFTSTYGSTAWKSKAATYVSQGNTPIKSWFGITYVINSYKTWTAGTSDDSTVRYTEMNQKVFGSSPLLIGFSGNEAIGDNGNAVGGEAGVGSDSLIVFDQADDYSNIVSLAHESGHSYNLSHCNSNCLMNAGTAAYQYFHNLCAPHTTQWNSQKNRY